MAEITMNAETIVRIRTVGTCRHCRRDEAHHANGWCVGMASRFTPYTKADIKKMAEEWKESMLNGR